MKTGSPKFTNRNVKGLSVPDIYSKIIEEKNDRIRKLEIVILTLAEADPELHNIQHLAKQALSSYNITGLSKGKKKS
tara:strand:+ start:6000 stop:6230 length:231 start_codon:yes stop_codon:yes gene_type:complete